MLKGIHCILPGGAEPRPYQLRLHFNGFCVKQTVYGLKLMTLRHEVGLSAGTWTKLNKVEEVSLSILLRICDYLNCDIGDICEAVRTDKN